jgi:hypothetical protein
MRATVLALSLPCLLFAQPGPGKRLARMEAQGEEGPLARQLTGVRIKQMRDVMGLSETQAAAIADRWALHDREIIQNTRQLNQLRGQFREILLGPGSEEDKSNRLKPMLDQFTDLRRKQMESRSRFETDIRAGLSPAQQARLIMMVDEFTRRLQEGLANRPGLLRRQQNQ